MLGLCEDLDTGTLPEFALFHLFYRIVPTPSYVIREVDSVLTWLDRRSSMFMIQGHDYGGVQPRDMVTKIEGINL